MNLGTIYIVATPIGNLEDMTPRAKRVFSEVEIIFAEDTRVTKKLLGAFEMQGNVKRLDYHKPPLIAEKIIEAIRKGDDVAITVDAGTPGISDPGSTILAHILKEEPTVSIIPVVGASSVTAALSISAKPSTPFTFLGFVPHKKGRKTFFESLVDQKYTIVFFESSHRILKTLTSLEEIMPEAEIVISKELTKFFEKTFRGKPKQISQQFLDDPSLCKGEFVIVI